MISNSEEANKYYRIINEYIDEYLDQWKINPENLKKYLKGNNQRMLNFLEKRGLKDIKNIGTVIDDIIDDRVAMVKDGVKTFEKFTNESTSRLTIKECLYRGVGRSSINHEKILADFYDVSLSQVDIVDSERHIFSVEGKKVCVYNDDDLNSIISNVKEFFANKIKDKSIELITDLSISLSDIIDIEKTDNILEEKIDIDSIKEIISTELKAKSVSDKNYIGEISG